MLPFDLSNDVCMYVCVCVYVCVGRGKWWEESKDGPKNFVLSLKIQCALQPILKYPEIDL